MDLKYFRYFVTFDLEGAESADYDQLYQHVHRNLYQDVPPAYQSYRYFKFPSGGWGFLPATSVVTTFSEQEAATPAEAGNKFREFLTRMKLVISRLSVSSGAQEMVEARVVDNKKLPVWLNKIYPTTLPDAIEI